MDLTLQANLRTAVGTSQAQRARAQGLVPAVIYGPGTPSEHVLVSHHEFGRVRLEAGETSFITLEFPEGKPTRRVLIRDMDLDPVKRVVRHVDFYEPRAGEKLRAKVPLVFVGRPPLIELEGGVLVKALQELEVISLPENLPHEITVDISGIQNFGEHILVRDIRLPAGVETHESGELVAASIVPPEKEAEAAPVITEEAVAEVKVEAEEKREKREALGKKPEEETP